MKTLEDITAEFIKACNVFGLVSAVEGGVIELDSLLIDFIKFIDPDKFILPALEEYHEYLDRFANERGLPQKDIDDTQQYKAKLRQLIKLFKLL